MSLTDRRLHVLRRLALLCAVMVLAVTSLSAFLRLSKAGLGCADWPACYGQDLRHLQQGIAAPRRAADGHRGGTSGAPRHGRRRRCCW